MNLVRKLIDMDAASPKRIAVVGDRMTDVYVVGRVEDTCQDGCPEFVEERRVERNGGAQNAANCLRHWQSTAQCFGQILGPIKTRYLAGTDMRMLVWRHDVENAADPDVWMDREADLCALRTGAFDAVLLSDYDKGYLTPEFIGQVAGICRERGVPCVADAKREPGVYEGCIIKANMPWANKYFACPDVCTDGAGLPGARGLNVDHNNIPVIMRSHVGAGDCFAAHLVLALAHGFSLEDATAVAHSAGRVYVQRLWNTPPRPEEVARDFAGEGAIIEKDSA